MTFAVNIKRGRFGLFSPGLLRHPVIRSLFGDRLVFRPGDGEKLSGVLGWGCKSNTSRAVIYAKDHGIPFLRLEDGFVRSVGLGVLNSSPFSLVLDDQGIYYDASRPSRLETIFSTHAFSDDPHLLATSRDAIAYITRYNISKYNLYPDIRPDAVADNGRKKVLIVSQTAKDLSLCCGSGEEISNDEMIGSILEDYPDAEIYLKVHPDVLVGKRKSSIDLHKYASHCTIISENINPVSLLKKMDVVCTKTSQMGFEALLLGKEVHCFGRPFYAGWGLTQDRLACPRRGRRLTIEALFAGAAILYTCYYNPCTGRKSDILDTLATIRSHRELRLSNTGDLYMVGFSGWKRFTHAPFFSSGQGNAIHFCASTAKAVKKSAKKGVRFYYWGANRPSASDLSLCKGSRVYQVEDGFIRSVLLGSDLTQPYSLVVDSRGIYFDPTAPSDLEHILETTCFSSASALMARASALIGCIRKGRMTKYNFQAHLPLAIPHGGKRPVILVPGQVEDDASVLLAGFGMTNETLLKTVREENPSAFLLYKPHPDVVSGNRKGHVSQQVTDRYADLVESRASLDSCLDKADELHTISSLCGFDALIRGKKVVTYGLPFYAGWGLTVDHHLIPRRTRKLTIEELVAGTLILYPRYIDPKTGESCEVERVLQALEEERSLYQASRRHRVMTTLRNKGVRLAQRAYALVS